MVVTAEAREVPPFGGTTPREVDLPVVDLQVIRTITAGNHTGRVPLEKCGRDRGRDVATDLADRRNVDPVGDEQRGDGVTHDLHGRLHRDRADSRDLTHLAGSDPTLTKRVQIDADVDLGA